MAFSVVAVLWNSISFTGTPGILFSLALGMAYGLTPSSARWGLIAGLVYGVLLSIVLGPLRGLSIGVAFLVGYFRIMLYLVEAPYLGCWEHLPRQETHSNPGDTNLCFGMN